MSGFGARTAMQGAINQIDYLIRDAEAQLARLRSVREDLHRQLHLPRATRECACGAAIPQQREMLGHTMCFRCEIATLTDLTANAGKVKRVPAMLHTVCQARQNNDQMMCGPCALAWDINDPVPPSCKLRSKLQSDKSKGQDNG